MIRRFVLRREPETDFKRIIADLQEAGYSHADIGFCLGVDRAVVWHWADGRTPRYEDAKALLKLHHLIQPALLVIRAANAVKSFKPSAVGSGA
jgi:hypothetical protein